MTMNLIKGSKVNLAKEAFGIRIAGIGLGWKPNESPCGPNFDLDVSAFLLGSNGKVPDDDYVVFYGSNLKTVDGRPQSGDQSVHGAVDSINRKVDYSEDMEDIKIFFDKVWEGVNEIVITVSITKYPNDVHKDRRTLGLNFSMISSCYVRVWDNETNIEYFRYNLPDDFTSQDAVEFGRFCRVEDGSWEFMATGHAYVGGLPKLIELYT